MSTVLGILDLSTLDLVIILGIILLLFGGAKLPELSRGLGKSINELKKGLSETAELREEVKSQVADTKAAVHGKSKAKKK